MLSLIMALLYLSKAGIVIVLFLFYFLSTLVNYFVSSSVICTDIRASSKGYLVARCSDTVGIIYLNYPILSFLSILNLLYLINILFLMRSYMIVFSPYLKCDMWVDDSTLRHTKTLRCC